MDEDNSEAYEAVPIHCFACATRDAETRRMGDARSSNDFGSGSFDGLYVSIIERKD